jgi:hypothetical protein
MANSMVHITFVIIMDKTTLENNILKKEKG